jgi:hypothetical protein
MLSDEGQPLCELEEDWEPESDEAAQMLEIQIEVSDEIVLKEEK